MLLLLSLAAAHLAEATEAGLSGRISFDYVPRWLDDTDVGDEDVHVGLLLDWGSSQDRFSGSLYWRGVKDADGVSGPAGGRFRSVYDTYGDDWFSELYYAYADVRSDGFLRRTRAGRQYLYEGQPFHFDGLSLRTRRGPGGLRATAFGGVPVHYFEESREGDWLLGLDVEMRPWHGGKIRAVYAHVDDDARFVGLPVTSEGDDLLVLSVGSRLGHWGRGLVRYTSVDGKARDVLARAEVRFERIDADVSFAYYAQPDTLAQFTTDLSVYSLVQGASHPYDRIDLCASKGFRTRGGWRVGLEARGSWRNLSEALDEGEYNRDYDFVRVGVGLEAPERRRFEASAGYASWQSSGDDVGAFDAEIRWRPTENLRLGLGTSYALYRYDVLSLREETDVRETFVKAQWSPNERVALRLRYAAEKYDGDLIHKMELGCSVEF